MKKLINQTGSALLYGILAVIIIGAGAIYAISLNNASTEPETNELATMEEGSMMEEGGADQDGEIMMEGEDAMKEENDTMMEEPVMDDGSDKTMEDTGAMMQEDIEAMLEKDDSMMDKADSMMENDVSAKAGVYTTYTTATYANSSDTKRVLFFHATWCPNCKEADADFSANLEKIPAGVTLLKTDYDNEKDLKNKYGVTYQHTFVQVDADGNAVTKWNGGGADELIARVK